MALVCVVEAVHVVRNPAGVGFDAYNFEAGVTLEDAAEHERAHDVLAAAHHREEHVHARTARRCRVTCGQDVERQRQPELDRRLPERVVHRGVVVLDRGIAGHHHAAEAQRCDRLEILDALLGGAHRGLPAAEEPVGMARGVLRVPAVVRLEARPLVVEVLVVADLHADGGVQHLGRDAVAQLVGEAGFRVPAAAVQAFEPHSGDPDLFRRLARRRHQAHRHRRLHPGDDEQVADVFAHELEMRSLIAPLGVDAVDVGVGRLGDVRIGGDHGKVHDLDRRPRRSRALRERATAPDQRIAGSTSVANRASAARASAGSAPSVGPVTISLSRPRSRRSPSRCAHVSGVPTMPKRSMNSGVSVPAFGEPTWVWRVMSYASWTAAKVSRSSGSTGPLTEPCITEKRANVATPPLASSRATSTSGCATTLTNEPIDVPPAARTVSMPQRPRSGSAPNASSTRSAWRAAAARTRGPVAATSTGTLGKSGGRKCRRLVAGALARPSVSTGGATPSWKPRTSNSTSSPGRYACNTAR